MTKYMIVLTNIETNKPEFGIPKGFSDKKEAAAVAKRVADDFNQERKKMGLPRSYVGEILPIITND